MDLKNFPFSNMLLKVDFLKDFQIKVANVDELVINSMTGCN